MVMMPASHPRGAATGIAGSRRQRLSGICEGGGLGDWKRSRHDGNLKAFLGDGRAGSARAVHRPKKLDESQAGCPALADFQ